MKKIILTSLLFLMIIPIADAYDLATQISYTDGKTTLSSVGYAKLGLIKIETSAEGLIKLHGTVSVNGKANIVMWVKVEGNYYFSKLPALQNIQDKDNINFIIPFNAAEKTITEIILEVELMRGGKVEVGNIKLKNG